MRKVLREDLKNFDRIYFINGGELVYGMFYEDRIYTNEGYGAYYLLEGIYRSPHNTMYYTPNETEILRLIISSKFNKDIVGESLKLHRDSGVIIDSKIHFCLNCGKESIIYEDIDWGGIYHTWDKCC